MQRDGFSKNIFIHLDENPAINGLENFKRSLEKDFFSRVQVRSCSCNGEEGSLVVEMQCPLVLGELLFHLEKGNWGIGELDIRAAQSGNTLANRVWELQKQNSVAIEIEELTFQLKDSVLVIKKIFPQSIEKELHKILQALTEHSNHFRKRLGEAIYEIYIPVLEENLMKIAPQAGQTEMFRNAYLQYWGLYFDSEEDAVIYDLKRRSFISGDLHMLNH